jgi:CheY-like chemotaxis protein
MTLATGQILVVDDEAPIRTTLAPMLQRAGYEVTAASDEEAISLLVAGSSTWRSPI